MVAFAASAKTYVKGDHSVNDWLSSPGMLNPCTYQREACPQDLPLTDSWEMNSALEYLAWWECFVCLRPRAQYVFDQRAFGKMCLIANACFVCVWGPAPPPPCYITLTSRGQDIDWIVKVTQVLYSMTDPDKTHGHQGSGKVAYMAIFHTCCHTLLGEVSGSLYESMGMSPREASAWFLLNFAHMLFSFADFEGHPFSVMHHKCEFSESFRWIMKPETYPETSDR